MGVDEAGRAMHMTIPVRLADAIRQLMPVHSRILVAIDGPDAAGKTTLAGELVRTLGDCALLASTDDFHYPSARRHQSGVLSAEGYYRDSFNNDALVEKLLRPFALGGSTVTVRQFDYWRDETAEVEAAVGSAAVLIVEGVFLLRAELRSWFTWSVYVHVPETTTLTRARERDLELFGSETVINERYERRYLPAQRLYRDEADPVRHANIVIDNSHPDRPTVVAWRHAGI